MEYEIREFQCMMCGNCCRGEGYVFITAEEGVRIAEFLGMSHDDFVANYCREPESAEQRANGGLWLIDQPGPEQACIFLENNRCRINPVKPSQCIGFPLKWRTPDILDYCEGMRRP